DADALSSLEEMYQDFGPLSETINEDKSRIIKANCKARGYALPARIAAHMNLDLKIDGLPRYILGIQNGTFCQVIGFMRFGAYPRASILGDLSQSLMLKNNVLNNLNPSGAYAILAMMIHPKHVRQGYGSAAFRYFMKDVLPRNISSFPYPEGPLSGIYMTMHTDNPVLNKFASLLKGVTFPISPQPVIMGKREDVSKMVMLLPVNPAYVMPEPSPKSEAVHVEDLEESE
ncbi:MAG: hypothetical protein Q8K36_06605, partial [Alphaproteobacteria bacterium]|nr:hypothetical protein [Alphaproteobacteria bacterium]